MIAHPDRHDTPDAPPLVETGHLDPTHLRADHPDKQQTVGEWSVGAMARMEALHRRIVAEVRATLKQANEHINRINAMLENEALWTPEESR